VKLTHPYHFKNPSIYQDISLGVSRILQGIGEDPGREGLRDTPMRVAKMYEELTAGYYTDPKDLFTQFEAEEYNSLVLVKEIPFFSLCEHHLVLFQGQAHVGYIPRGKVVGISKLARLVDVFAKRLQVQERMTVQIADSIVEHLSPNCMVVIEAEHLCMAARGVKKPGAKTVTSAVRGDFLNEPEARMEFLSLVKG
jgi:GTP cyclohydrolase IA